MANNRGAHGKKRTFTKKLLILFIGVALFLTALAAGLAVVCPENAALGYIEALAGVWFGGTTVFTGFYCRKSERENKNKYSQQWIADIGEKYGWEAAARFAELTIKEG